MLFRSRALTCCHRLAARRHCSTLVRSTPLGWAYATFWATLPSKSTMALAANPEYSMPVIRYRYSSMITPNSVYEYDLASRKSTLIKQDEIPSGHDKTKYETSRVWATARDGVKVPILLVTKKGTKLDGSAPMLLYGYGSYGVSLTPSFSSARYSLIDRGMIYAIPLIRGGGELGEGWRLAGRMFTKMNTFNDFVDSAKWLIANKYTSSDRLVIQGGSAGDVLARLKLHFRDVKFVKPKASRADSSEVYVVALGFKGRD